MLGPDYRNIQDQRQNWVFDKSQSIGQYFKKLLSSLNFLIVTAGLK